MTLPEPHAAAVQRHPHLEAPRRDGCARVDLHSHTMWSGDSTTTPDEIERAVMEAGLDVLCLTDHSAIKGAVELAPRLEALGCRVVVGEEMKTQAGELIGLFLTERVPAGTTAVEAARRIRDQGGVVYVPHPFDPMRRNIAEPALYELAELGLIDVVEVFNAKTSLQSLNRRAAEFAAEFGLPGGAGSDAHVPNAIGSAYVEMPPFSDAAEFLTCLRSATVIGHHWDEPRPWTPRIVPSVTLE